MTVTTAVSLPSTDVSSMGIKVTVVEEAPAGMVTEEPIEV